MHWFPSSAGRGLVVAACAMIALAAATPAAGAQAASPEGPLVSLKLADGSIVVGRVVKQDETVVTLSTEALGVVTIDRAKITQLLSGGAAAKPAAPSVHWTRTFQIRGTYASAVVPGYIGETKGVDFSAKLLRRSDVWTGSLRTAASYQKTDPNPASSNDASATMILTHAIRGPFHLLSESILERNRIEEIDYRITEHLGIGWNAVSNKTAWLLIAPGLAYTQQHAPDSSRIRNVAGGKFQDGNGLGFGGYEALDLKLAEGLSLNQDILMIHGFDGTPKLQYTGTATVLGMVSKFLGLTIGYSRRYDSTLPAPINRTLDQLLSGIQISF